MTASAPAAAELEGRHPASERVAAELRQAILAGGLPPGTRLRQEDLAERFGSSRIPVREALRMLVAEGLVEHQPHRGARIPVLSARQLDVLYRMRERLEPLALAESLPGLTGADLDRMDALEERIEEWRGVTDFLALDRELHLLSYSGCDVEPLRGTVTGLWNATQHYRRVFVEVTGPGSRWVVAAEHRLLIDAMRRADADDAGLHLAGHIRRTRVELGRHPEIFAGA